MARDKRVLMWISQREEMLEEAWDLRMEFYGKPRNEERIAKENAAERLEMEAEELARYIQTADADAMNLWRHAQ